MGSADFSGLRLFGVRRESPLWMIFYRQPRKERKNRKGRFSPHSKKRLTPGERHNETGGQSIIAKLRREFSVGGSGRHRRRSGLQVMQQLTHPPVHLGLFEKFL